MIDPRDWLDVRLSTLAMERAVSEAVLRSGGRAPVHPNDPRIVASPGDLRGIPAIGRDCPGASPGTRPDHAVH